jgi:hypothetical protein
MSKEQSPNVVRSKSKMASTSRSNVELGKGLSISIDGGLKSVVVGAVVTGDGCVGVDLVRLIWWRMIAKTIRRKRGLDRSMFFKREEINWSSDCEGEGVLPTDDDDDSGGEVRASLNGDFDSDEYALSNPENELLSCVVLVQTGVLIDEEVEEGDEEDLSISWRIVGAGGGRDWFSRRLYNDRLISRTDFIVRGSSFPFDVKTSLDDEGICSCTNR